MTGAADDDVEEDVDEEDVDDVDVDEVVSSRLHTSTDGRSVSLSGFVYPPSMHAFCTLLHPQGASWIP